MAGQIQCGRRVRRDFGKIASIVEIPNLIEIQRNSYEAFLQKDYSPEHREDMGLQAVFKSVFPISDYNENASLEFVGYHFGDPKYTVEECHDRGMTHAIPLKVTLRLVVYEQDKSARHRAVKDIKEQEVYLGELPLMTEKGTFIINGTERVVVSQLQRSAGVFFDDDRGKTLASGKKIFSARIIPYRGSWVEFEFDANDILQVRIDRRRKMLATAFLRAFCFLEKGTVLSDEEILGAFYDLEEVVGFEDGAAVVKLNPEIHRHETPVAEDIKPPRHREAIVQAGRRLNKARVERMVEAGITKFPVPMAWLENRRTGGRVVDSKTGEVLLEANQPLTSNELAKLAARPVAPFKVVFEDPGQERRLRARDADAGHAPEPGRGAGGDVPAAAPGRSADRGVGPRALPRHVPRPPALRPGAGRALHAEQEARDGVAAQLEDAPDRGHRGGGPAPPGGQAGALSDGRHRPPREPARAVGRASSWRTSSAWASPAWSGRSRSGCPSPTSRA